MHLFAAGLSLIFGLMEIVNFAHGEHLMLSMFSSFWLWSLFGLDPLFSIPITILLMAFCGVLTHYFLIRYILKAKMLIQICATFGLSIFIRSIAQLLWTPDFRNVDKPLLEGRLELGSVFIGQPQLYASLVCLVAFIGLYLFVTKTETGLALQATAQDRHAAEVLGIPSNKMFAIGWAIGTWLCGCCRGNDGKLFFHLHRCRDQFCFICFCCRCSWRIWKHYRMFVCRNYYRISRIFRWPSNRPII
jgi:branched-chain amino acid transport system permease protein